MAAETAAASHGGPARRVRRRGRVSERMNARRRICSSNVGRIHCGQRATPATLAGRNPQPPPRTVRAYTLTELDAIAAELSERYRPLPAFAAATGLRPVRRDAARAVSLNDARRVVS